MAVVKPFYCIRPREDRAAQVAALPYDVYSREEARRAVAGRPLLFLNIDRPETQFSQDMDMYDDRVYEKAQELFDEELAEGVFVREEAPRYFLYELTMDGRSQTGIAGCCAIDDYLGEVIKKHENTREEKELDRIRHVDRMDAQTGPIFLAYRHSGEIQAIVEQVKRGTPLYDFAAEDDVRHRVWRVEEPGQEEAIRTAFERIPSLYIADGHHRAASAVKVGLMRRKEHPDYTGEEPFNYFLSVLFPDAELSILPYNRVVRDLNGLGEEAFLAAVRKNFEVRRLGAQPFAPEEKGSFGMFLEDTWYCLKARQGCLSSDPVKGLDVSVLQDYLLGPVLGIEDPRTDKRIDFVGGIRGLKELERRVREGMAAAFSMYPTSMEELLAVADAGRLMPPKSTWFEPKLRSGLFIHRLS